MDLNFTAADWAAVAPHLILAATVLLVMLADLLLSAMRSRAIVPILAGLSLVGVVLWGSLTGSSLPFLFRRLGFDPASASAPFVATLVDVTGLIIYFTFASLLLRGTLL